MKKQIAGLFWKFILCVTLNMISVFALANPSPYPWDSMLHFIGYDTKSQNNISYDEIGQPYIKPILEYLRNPKNFDRVLNDILIPKNNDKISLNANQKGVLLALCAYEQSRQRQKVDKRTWDILIYNVGDSEAMSLFLDNDEASSEYNIFKIKPDTYVYTQLTGRGAHNNGYLVWLIQTSNTPRFHLMAALETQTIIYNEKDKQLITHGSEDEIIKYQIDEKNYLLIS